MINLRWTEITELTSLTEKEQNALSGVTGEQKRNMDTGGVNDGEVDALSFYRAEFDYDGTVKSEYCLFDLGILHALYKVKFFLNGVEIGSTNSREVEAAYLINKSLLQSKNILIAAIIAGAGEDMWIKGKGKISYLPEGYVDDEHELPHQADIKPLSQLPSVTAVRSKGNRVELSTDTAPVTLEFFEGGIFRFRLFTAQNELLVNSVCLEDNCLTPENELSLTETDINISVKCRNIEVIIQKSPISVKALRDGVAVFEQSCEAMMSEGGCGIALRLSADEDIYGLGENATPTMNKRGTREDIWVSHDWIKCDVPLPFYISSNGYGFYLNNSYHSYFDMGLINSNTALVWALGGELDYFVMLADTPKQIVADYCKITGKTKLPPRWAFGFYRSKTGLETTQTIKEKTEQYREHQFPLDVVCIDPPWENLYNDFQFDRNNFPSTEELMGLIKDNRLHLMLWSSPFLVKQADNYADGDKNGYFLRDSKGNTAPVVWWKDDRSGIVDFTNPDACDWWQGRINDRLKEGTEIIKIDGGDGGSVPATIMNYEGRSGTEFHNLYPVYYAKSVYDGAQALTPNKRVMVWERTGFVGNSRYPCTWGGDQSADFTGTRVLIKGGQQAGLCGIFYWSPDVGGFGECEGTDAEFFIRSYQWGAFCPLCRSHGNKADPFDFGEKASEMVAEYIRLRYRLLPYFYSMGYKAYLESVPVMRSMFLEYPQDKICRDLDYQYFVGDSFMLAPITRPFGREDMSADRAIYMPDDFVDFFTERVYKKGEKITYHADIERLPLFVKRGSIIPMLNTVMSTEDYTGKEYKLHLYPNECESEFVLYFDDGVSMAYQRGEYDAIKITCFEKAEGVHLSFSTLSDCMNMGSIGFEVFVHSGGRVTDYGRVEYNKDNLNLIL